MRQVAQGQHGLFGLLHTFELGQKQIFGRIVNFGFHRYFGNNAKCALTAHKQWGQVKAAVVAPYVTQGVTGGVFGHGQVKFA